MNAGFRFVFICSAALAWSSMANAQNSKLLQAERLFQRLNYQEAIEVYHEILKKKQVPEALFHLAESYRKIGDTKNAEVWYSQAILHPEATPEMYFYLGQALLANDKVAAAKTQFEKFRELSPDQRRGINLVKACNDTLRQELMNTGTLYLIKNIEEANSSRDDFGASLYLDGLVFCSERDTAGAAVRRSAWTGRSFVGTYYIDRRLVDEDKLEFKYGKIEEFAKKMNSRYHDGPVTFTNDYQEAYLTRNTLKGKNGFARGTDGIIGLGIYRTTRKGDDWSALESVSFNNPEFRIAQAALNADGDKMYFSSDMEGGFGGMDLYVSYAEGNGRWSEPINLGPQINTEGDEIFPFVNSAGNLFFASDGHTGLGGFDIYFSRARRGVWEPLQNVGYPINSQYDDFSYVSDSAGVVGYFSSNREGGLGLTDVYSFTKLTVEAEILVFDKGNGQGLENIKLTTECFPKKEFITNVDGKVYIELPLNRACTFTVFSEEYGNTTVNISTEGFTVGAVLFFDVPMAASEANFQAKGSVRDKKGNPIANAEVVLSSSCGTKNQTVTTNSVGDYEFKLDPNCCYVARVSKQGYFTSIDTFCTKGKTKSQTFESNVTMPKFWEENMINNIDTSSIYIIDNIYYATGAYQVDVKRSPGLEDLLNLLRSNPDLAVEIRSHTDSRGTNEANNTLSTKRAKSVVDYLIEKGIAEDRMGYKGFGESQLINACTDAVPCTDEEHQQNRRTEFKVTRLSSK